MLIQYEAQIVEMDVCDTLAVTNQIWLEWRFILDKSDQ